MPVKTLKPSYISVTGKLPSLKNGRMNAFESLLERNYFLKLEKDKTVAGFEEYPLELYWIDQTGLRRRYTPDVKVTFVDVSRRPIIVEVKSSEEVIKKFDEFKLKYRAIRHQIHSRGCGFRLITERSFNLDEAKNLHFLKRYTKVPICEDFLYDIQRCLGEGEQSAYQLVQYLSPSLEHQIHYQTQVWACLAQGLLDSDLSVPLKNSALVFLPGRSL